MEYLASASPDLSQASLTALGPRRRYIFMFSRLLVVRREVMKSFHSLLTLGLFTHALQHFDIDVGHHIPMFRISYSLYQASCSLCHCIAAFFLSHFTLYIEIDGWDVLYNHLIGKLCNGILV